MLVRRALQAIACLFLAMIVFTPLAVQPSVASDEDALVSVNGVPISRQELETAVTERSIRTFQTSDPHRLRTFILRDMILQEIANQLMTEQEIASNPPLKRRLELDRRSLLFDAYVQKRLPATARVSEPQIDQFIADHPEFFQDRRMYHFGEMIIEAKSDVQAKSIRERLNLIAELKHPSPEQFDAVGQWAASNYYQYGVVKDWRPTEKLTEGLDKILLALDKSDSKVQVETKNKVFRLVVLFAAYPDAINPLFAKTSVAQRLAREIAQKHTDAIVSEMLARSNVVLYDKDFRDLNLPKKLAPFQKNQPSKLTERLFFAWNFALFLLIPAALYNFFRHKYPNYEDPRLSYFDHLSYQLPFRAGFVVIVGSLMLFFAGVAVLRMIDPYDSKRLAIAAVSGLGLGLALVASAARIPWLANMFTSRWSAILVVAAAEISLMAALGPDFT
jgi:EpsD family peptidyl-prolyl cis-trans isomerase